MAVVKINAITVPPERREQMEERFAGNRGSMDGTPGYLGFELLRPTSGDDRYFVITRWESDEAFRAWRSGSTPDAAHAQERRDPTATGADLLEFEVVLGSDGHGGHH
ncbi:antibiotic biosynthesis monooxygenase family protein [Actinomycetospora sp. CA-084318]|uniref:antibiotic biosynthesis monooxygenase family protein n=1 Tax=Actinomycetospora sp. CA-084318 TaxID=3239892 RepID=UPI003D963FE9